MEGRHPLERCKHLFPGLRSKPWWNEDNLTVATKLEENFPRIRDEFFNIVLCGRLKLHPQSLGGPRKQITDGDWNIFELSSFGQINDGNGIEAPFTARLFKSLMETDTPPSGLSYFSVLQPHVHIAPHCGPTNTRIRSHLGLRVPDGATMRVGYETKSWEEGRCLVFDDSWEHEVYNRSPSLRAVLLVDIWHPDLTHEQRVDLIRTRRQRSESRRQQREGWQRTVDVDPASLPSVIAASMHESAAAMTVLTPNRLASIRATAARFVRADSAFIAMASTLVLVDPGATPWSATLARAGELCASDVFGADVWGCLQKLLRRYVGPDLSGTDLVNLVHICSLFWRCHPRNTRSMAAFLNAWPVADKAALLQRLVDLGTIHNMVDYLVAYGTDAGRPPFGATAPLIAIAAYERFCDGPMDPRAVRRSQSVLRAETLEPDLSVQ